MHDSCIEIFDEISCRAAVGFCQDAVSGTYENSGASLFGGAMISSYLRAVLKIVLFCRTQLLRHLEG